MNATTKDEEKELRAREAAAKRQKRSLPNVNGADARFKRDFLDRSFGHSCKVCDRLWFDNNLTKIANIQNAQSRANAIAVLRCEFAADDAHGEYLVCSTCKDSLVAGKLPAMSVANGYRYPPRPDHLPALNPVEERLIAPRLPFMSIRRLTHGNGQYGIKGQVVNVPIDVQKTVQCLPRSIPDDAAIDVHIDLVYANFRLHPIEEPLALHFTDHKAVVMKAKRNASLGTTYAL